MNQVIHKSADFDEEQNGDELILHLGVVIKNTTESIQSVFLFKREHIPYGVILSPAFQNAWVKSEEMAREFMSASYKCKSIYIENKSGDFKEKEHVYVVLHTSDIFGRSGTVNLAYCGSLTLRKHQAQKNKIFCKLPKDGIFINKDATLEITIPARTEYVLFLDLTSN